MKNPWTDRHTEGIEKLYSHLLASLQPAQSRLGCIKILEELSWPHGPYSAEEGVAATVRKVIGNKAAQERLKQVMEKELAAGSEPRISPPTPTGETVRQRPSPTTRGE